MLKTYFCKLVLGFSPNQNQSSLGQFSGVWTLQINNYIHFFLIHLVGYNRVI